ncbi:hypothetical protein HYV49_02505 [Candidatus Pacearchaeota archaeon]|nr:hypothetical protein [Candidatus Pacearchaeota archaeon]
MQIRETTRQEIEEKASKMSDFLKMEYLEKCIKSHISLDIRKFAHTLLSDLYEKRSMYVESAKHKAALAELTTTFKDKKNAFVQEAELWIKASHFLEADNAVKKALACSNTIEKQEVKNIIKQIYKNHATLSLKNQKNAAALKFYEKLSSFELTDEEKKDMQRNLLFLYDKLGKVREYYKVKKALEE